LENLVELLGHDRITKSLLDIAITSWLFPASASVPRPSALQHEHLPVFPPRQ
jgi:hypothetical protein